MNDIIFRADEGEAAGDHAARAKEIAEAVKTADAKKRADAENGDMGQKLDKILSGLDGVTKVCDALAKRMDALEQGGQKTEQEEDDPAAAVDAAPSANEERRKNEIELADAQQRADSASNAWGERAPPPMSGEKLAAYRIRLLRRHQPLSAEWKGIDLTAITDPKIFATAETRIYADSRASSVHPDSFGDRLIQRTKVDQNTGRRTIEFFGNRTFIQGMTRPPRRVSKFLVPAQQ